MVEAIPADISELSASLANVIHSIWIIILILMAVLLIPGKRAAGLAEKYKALGKIMGENRQKLRVLVVFILVVQALLYAAFFHINAETGAWLSDSNGFLEEGSLMKEGQGYFKQAGVQTQDLSSYL